MAGTILAAQIDEAADHIGRRRNASHLLTAEHFLHIKNISIPKYISETVKVAKRLGVVSLLTGGFLFGFSNGNIAERA